MYISATSVHQLISWLSYPGFQSIGVAGTVWCLWTFLLLGLGASGLPPLPPPRGCGLLATSPHHSGLGHPGGPLAGFAGLVAGLRVGQAFGVFLPLASMCDSGIKY